MTIDDLKALVATGDRTAEGWNSSLVMGALDKEILALVEAVSRYRSEEDAPGYLILASDAFNAKLESMGRSNDSR